MSRKRKVTVALLLGIGVVVAWAQVSNGAVKSCGKVLGNDTPRIRSSQVRMRLADPGAAADRFLPFAAMSALAYEEGDGCKHPHPLENKQRLLSLLEDWKPVTDIAELPECDDEFGLFYRVWKRERPDAVEVVLAFRGTGGFPDWLRGNLRWATRFWPGDDQYDRSRDRAHKLVLHFLQGPGKPASGKPVRFFTTGHSLGGGLAQTAYYHLPGQITQAIAFNSSPVTGYMDQEDEVRRKGCTCREELGAESRVYRVYESNEILAWARFPLKIVLPLHRHIQEVRFGFARGNGVSQHSMENFAIELANLAEQPRPASSHWYDGAEERCTALFEEKQSRICKLQTDRICP